MSQETFGYCTGFFFMYRCKVYILPEFYSSFKKLSKQTSSGDSQPGLCSSDVLKIWVNVSLNVLLKKFVTENCKIEKVSDHVLAGWM